MSDSPTILIVDDDIELCQAISKLLSEHGMRVIIANDDSRVEDFLKTNSIDLILLDIILHGKKDGIALCQSIRQLTDIPIIMLSGIQADIEKILSLEIGADNYITKPFNSRVLLAHIHANLRRQSEKQTQSHLRHSDQMEVNYQLLEFQGWKLNINARLLLSPDNKPIQLTSSEYTLLHSFLNNPQVVLTREQLLDHINIHSDAYDRSIDILISRLRAKIEGKNEGQPLIRTVRNSGYVLASFVRKTTITSAIWQAMLEKSSNTTT